jgi:hypothetical protein
MNAKEVAIIILFTMFLLMVLTTTIPQDFTYPDNVAYPFGGEGYIMMELHFDNPKEIEGTRDSSGMRLWYTTTPREYDAGIFEVGYFIGVDHVIPPNSENFVTQCILPGQCTTKVRVSNV